MYTFSLIKHKVEITGKILPAEDYIALVNSKELLEKSKESCEELIKEGKEKAKKIREEAKKQGHKEGIEQFAKLLLELEELKKETTLKLQQSLIPLVVKATQKVVKAELKVNSDVVVNIISDCIEDLSGDKKITIYVSEQDIKNIPKDLNKLFGQIESLEIKPREDITPGGAILETESCIVNSTIEHNFGALKEWFKDYL